VICFDCRADRHVACIQANVSRDYPSCDCQHRSDKAIREIALEILGVSKLPRIEQILREMDDGPERDNPRHDEGNSGS
jgi:hypothetical protein